MRPIVFALVAGLAVAEAGAQPTANVAPDLAAALVAATATDGALARAIADRDAAAENIPIARSRLLPQVSMVNSYQHFHQISTSDSTGLETTYRGPSASNGVSLRQAVFRPRDWMGLNIGQRQAEYGELKLVSAQADLWSRTSNLWVDVLVAQELRDAYARTLESVARAAAQEKRRFEMGDGTRDAAAEAAAQLALARARHAEAKADLQAKIDAFNVMTKVGARDFARFRMPAPESLTLLPEVEESFVTRAVDSNAEVAAARVAVTINEMKLRQAETDHMPVMDFIASGNKSASDTFPTLGMHYKNASVGVQVQVPIYSGGGISASARQTAAQLASASADLDAMIQRLRAQSRLDWGTQQGQFERVQAAAELVKSGREARRAVEFQIRAGQRTWADLGSAELLLSQRETDLVNLTGATLKTQVRLLSLLPASDAAWEKWVGDTTRLALR